MEFKLTSDYSTKNNRWEVQLSGEVDIFGSVEFKASLIALTEKRECNLYIDCSKLEYIDSTGLGSLVAVLKRVKQYSGSITLLNLHSNILKLFKITNLDKVFEIIE